MATATILAGHWQVEGHSSNAHTQTNSTLLPTPHAPTVTSILLDDESKLCLHWPHTAIQFFPHRERIVLGNNRKPGHLSSRQLWVSQRNFDAFSFQY